MYDSKHATDIEPTGTSKHDRTGIIFKYLLAIFVCVNVVIIVFSVTLALHCDSNDTVGDGICAKDPGFDETDNDPNVKVVKNEHSQESKREPRTGPTTGVPTISRLDCWREYYKKMVATNISGCRRSRRCLNYKIFNEIDRLDLAKECPTRRSKNRNDESTKSTTNGPTTTRIPTIGRNPTIVRMRRSATNATFEVLATVTKVMGSIVTDCPIEIWVYEWTNYRRVVGSAGLNGKEFFTMLLMRGSLQRRYYGGKLIARGRIPNGKMAGYLRTEDNRRFFFIPRYLTNVKCTVTNTDEKVVARGYTIGSRYRLWEMFMNRKGTKTVISYENMEFRHLLSEPNESAFVSAGLLKKFFETVQTPDNTESPEVQTYREIYEYLKSKQDKSSRNRRAAIRVPTYVPVSNINTEYNYNSMGYVWQEKCESYLTGTKVLTGVEYYAGDDGDAGTDDQWKVYPVCKKIIDGESCASLETKYPGWYGCKWSALKCGFRIGTSDAAQSGSNKDIGKMSRVSALIITKANLCIAVKLNAGILKSERLTITNDQNLNAQIGNLASSYQSTLDTIRAIVDLREDDVLSLSQRFNDVNNNFQGIMNTTDSIQASLNKSGDILYKTTEVIDAVAKELSYISKVRLKYLEDTVQHVLEYLVEVGAILHHPFVYNRTEPPHRNLDHLLQKASHLVTIAHNHSKEVGTYVRSQLTIINTTFASSDKIYKALDEQDNVTMKIVMDNKKVANGLQSQADFNKKQIEIAKNASEKSDKTMEKSMYVGVKKGPASWLGGSAKAQLNTMAGLAVGLPVGVIGLVFLVIAFFVIRSCCKQRDSI